jgi:hypothetical protein
MTIDMRPRKLWKLRRNCSLRAACFASKCYIFTIMKKVN